MDAKQIFTNKELREMGTRTLDLVIDAIEAGDKEKAKESAQRMYREFNYFHDGYMTWVTGLLTYIYKNNGIDAVEEAEREAHTIEAKIAFKPSGKVDIRSRVESLVSGLRGHLQPITVEEDVEKISVTMKPCGSGERIIQKGGYNRETGLATVKNPHRITWGLSDFPIYCVHCPVMETLEIERNGNFNFVHIITQPMHNGACHFTFYKDDASIPQELYTRIGKKKPPLKKKLSIQE